MDNIAGNKTYRHLSNPLEKTLHDSFINHCNTEFSMERISLPTDDTGRPKEFLTDREKAIMISTIQWLGSPVGLSFLKACGFKAPEGNGYDTKYPNIREYLSSLILEVPKYEYLQDILPWLRDHICEVANRMFHISYTGYVNTCKSLGIMPDITFWIFQTQETLSTLSICLNTLPRENLRFITDGVTLEDIERICARMVELDKYFKS